jgi:hypothetical protein
MSRVAMSLAFVLATLPVYGAQQSTSSQATTATSANPARAAIPTLLSKSLDAKKLKVGDEVTTKTSIGMRAQGAFIPSGSNVVGHVTSVQTRANGDAQSSLGITFDKIELPGGKQVAIHGVIQAVAASARPEPTTGAAGSGTIGKDTGHDQGSTVPGPVSTVGPLGSDSQQGVAMVDPRGTGVLGIRNLELDQNAVLVTTAKDLKLESGTQLIIRAEFAPSAQ